MSVLTETTYEQANEVISAAVDYNRVLEQDSAGDKWEYKSNLKNELDEYIDQLEFQLQDYTTSEITNDAAVDLDSAIGKIRNLEKLSRVKN